jgi:hypothetical protein
MPSIPRRALWSKNKQNGYCQFERFAISSSFQTWSETRAAISGVIHKVLRMRGEVVMHDMYRDKGAVVLNLLENPSVKRVNLRIPMRRFSFERSM